MSIRRNQQLGLHDLFDHRPFLPERLRFKHRFERALDLIDIRELLDVYLCIRHAEHL